MVFTVTIQAGQSLSNAVPLEGAAVVAVQLPADWEGNANISFQGSHGDGNYFDVFDRNGSEYVAIGAASRYVVIPRGDIAELHTMKVRSGTKDVPIAQTGAKTLRIYAVRESRLS